eukprot:scaffold228205_cov29-Tisochrysis_lutea.AAC.6
MAHSVVLETMCSAFDGVGAASRGVLHLCYHSRHQHVILPTAIALSGVSRQVGRERSAAFRISGQLCSVFGSPQSSRSVDGPRPSAWRASVTRLPGARCDHYMVYGHICKAFVDTVMLLEALHRDEGGGVRGGYVLIARTWWQECSSD